MPSQADRGKKTSRQVAIADHLWAVYEEMAGEMGSSREQLVNQALYMYARLHGFLETARAASAESPVPLDEPFEVPRASAPARPRTTDREGSSARPLEQASARSSAPRDVAPRASEAIAPVSRTPAPVDAAEGISLFLIAENGEMRKIDKATYVIGRDKKCDFLIDSGKVSREHARITREGTAYFMEDLNSSNGTWFRQERITRRRIEDGDVYFICNEKIRCVLR